jgi:hypothetical protein
MLALEWVLRRAGQRREAITYEDLAHGERAALPASSAAGAGIQALHAPTSRA